MGERVESPETETAASYDLAYDEAVRALGEQQTTLDNTRTRAGTLVAASAIATSFLGGQALQGTSPSAWTWIATFCFLGVGAVTVLILLPQEQPKLTEDGDPGEAPDELEKDPVGWGRWVSPGTLIADYIEVDGPPVRPSGPTPTHLIKRDLALYMETIYDRNRMELNRLNRYFKVAAILLGIEILAWIVDLASTG